MNFEKAPSGILVPDGNIVIGGAFFVEHYRQQKSGKLRKIYEDFVGQNNIVVNEGLNYLLNAGIDGSPAAITTWYLSLFKGNYTPLATNTASMFSSTATEVLVSDLTSPASRPVYNPAASTAQSLTNAASKASFVFDASITVYGAFIQSTSAFANQTGTLLCAAKFGASRSVIATDQLDVTYVINATSS